MINEIHSRTDLLPSTLVHRIQGALVDPQLDWHYNKHTEVLEPDAFEHAEHYRKHEFYHPIYRDRTVLSELYHIVEPVLLFFTKEYKLPVLELHSIVAYYRFPQPNYNEMSFSTPEVAIQPHSGSEWMQLTYFSEHSDGDLIVWENRVDERPMPYKLRDARTFKPEAGLCVMRDAHRYTSHRAPQNSRDRWHIEFVFRVQ